MSRRSASLWLSSFAALLPMSCASLAGIDEPILRGPPETSVDEDGSSDDANGSGDESPEDDWADADGTVTSEDAGDADATVGESPDALQPADEALETELSAVFEAGAMDGSDSSTGDPCLVRQVDDARGLYVAPTGFDDATCGTTRGIPCRTIGVGIGRALATGRPSLYVAAGTYIESIAVQASLSLEGSWIISTSGGTWTPACGGDAGLATTLRAPSDGGATVIADAIGGTASLSWLEIDSKSSSDVAPGESVYGVMATGSTTSLALEHVTILVAGGGDGVAGQQGSPGADAAPGACGSEAGSTNPGLNDGGDAYAGGQFGPGGYVPANGASGAIGMPGAAGSADDFGACSNGCGMCDPSCTLVLDDDASCGGSGRAGCGGGGGGGGEGGTGGGSSVAIYVWNAAVTCSFCSLITGSGGMGGAGGPGADGGEPSEGQPGLSVDCVNSCTPACDDGGCDLVHRGCDRAERGGCSVWPTR